MELISNVTGPRQWYSRFYSTFATCELVVDWHLGYKTMSSSTVKQVTSMHHVTNDRPSQAKAKKNKASCTWRASSLGQSWITTCPECKQIWHDACAKCLSKRWISKNNPQYITKILSWPWCYSFSYSEPSNHQSMKIEQFLKENISTTLLLDETQESAKSIVERTFTQNNYENW